jgi:AAA domain/Bifunctional DNA primase/polymerase, N-terminal/Primase C terminal 2 (PriCT-2)
MNAAVRTLAVEKKTLTDIALDVAQNFGPVFPCNAKKEPVVAGGFHAASRDPAEVRRLFSLPGAKLIGIPTGAASGLLVVDTDGPAGAEWLDIRRLILPATLEHATRRGGAHLIFKMPPENIPCSTGKVAPGVDIRASGGYFIFWPAMGLPFEAHELAEVPEFILEAARSSKAPLEVAEQHNEMSATFKDKVGLPASDTRAMLARLDPGCSYEIWYKVGLCLSHEYGDAGLDLWREWSARSAAKYPGDEAILSKWDSFGRGGGTPITLRYLMKLTKQAPAEAKPLIVEGRTSPYQFVDVADLMARKPPGWIVRGLIPAADLGMLFAQSGAGKTFFTLDVALHIATGLAWRGLDTKKLRVLYVCAEGAGGFGIRVKAALQANDQLATAMAGERVFEVLPGAPNFLDDKGIDALVTQAKGLGGFDFVVVDTLAQVTPGGNENSGEDMGRAIGNCRKFNAEFGAFVLLLHHPGKDESRGARGWSGVRGALDVELEITCNGDERVVRVAKQKEGTEGERFGFRLVPQDVAGSVDHDGFPVVSCHVEPLADLPKSERRVKKDGHVASLIVRHAADLAGITGGAISGEVLYKAVREEMTRDPAKKDRRRERFDQALEKLASERRLAIKGELVELLP